MTMKKTLLAFLTGIMPAVIPSIALPLLACSAAHSLTASLHGSTSSSSASSSSASSSDASSAGPSAQEKRDAPDDNNSHPRMKELAERMPGLAPDPGRDTAPVRPPPWCGSVKLDPHMHPPQYVGTKYEGWKKNGFLALIEAAELSCHWAKAPEMQVAASMIEQTWINLTGLSEPDAVESIGTHA
jgi:hypothetical protein